MSAAADDSMGVQLTRWADLTPGTPITVVKLAPDGVEAARYPGKVVAQRQPGDWVIVRATWTYPMLDVDGLQFVPGDTLLEWFSPLLPFNAFAIVAPQGGLRGWYANVTRPAYLRVDPARTPQPTLVWHDLYLDLVALPNGTTVLRDEDELHAAAISRDDQNLMRMIHNAGNELQRRFIEQCLPFASEVELIEVLDVSKANPASR